MDGHPISQNCKQLLGNLSDYIDGELQEELCAELEQHMEGCEDCRIVVDTLKKTVELYKQTCEPLELPGAVKERLYLKLDLEPYLKSSR